jgi:hypothetical protein
MKPRMVFSPSSEASATLGGAKEEGVSNSPEYVPEAVKLAKMKNKKARARAGFTDNIGA